MNRVEFSVENTQAPLWLDAAQLFIQKVLTRLSRDNWDLSVMFCDNEYIRELNARFRDKDEATDILSFPLSETVIEDGLTRYLPGDLVISLEMLEENARYFSVSCDEELRRLFIHGILHLDGMDHVSNAETEPMLQFQEEIVAQLKGERILP